MKISKMAIISADDYFLCACTRYNNGLPLALAIPEDFMLLGPA